MSVPADVATCSLCGGEVGPDITGRPMCYRCGPGGMAPRDARERAEARAAVRDNPGADEKALLGVVMRALRGQANPAVVLRCIREEAP